MKHAPDINSEVYFPSLSAAMGTDDPNRGQGQANRSVHFLYYLHFILTFPGFAAIEDLKK